MCSHDSFNKVSHGGKFKRCKEKKVNKDFMCIKYELSGQKWLSGLSVRYEIVSCYMQSETLKHKSAVTTQ